MNDHQEGPAGSRDRAPAAGRDRPRATASHAIPIVAPPSTAEAPAGSSATAMPAATLAAAAAPVVMPPAVPVAVAPAGSSCGLPLAAAAPAGAAGPVAAATSAAPAASGAALRGVQLAGGDDEHLTSAILRQFMLGTLPRCDMRLALRHLLHGCTDCQARAREVWNLDLESWNPERAEAAAKAGAAAGAIPVAANATVAMNVMAAPDNVAPAVNTAGAGAAGTAAAGTAAPGSVPSATDILLSLTSAPPRLELAALLPGGAGISSLIGNPGAMGAMGAMGSTASRGRLGASSLVPPLPPLPPAAAAGEGAAPRAAAGNGQEASYDLALDRVFSRLVRAEAAIEAARRHGRELFDELMQHPPTRQGLLVHNSLRFRDRFLCEELLVASRDEGFRDGARSEELAALAVAISGQLLQDAKPLFDGQGLATAELGDRLLLAGMRARAWAQLGNALRILVDMDGAGKAFDAADAIVAAHPGIGPLDKARVLDLRASFSMNLRQFADAAKLLDRVIAIYRRLGQRGLLGRALNQKALVLGEQGNLKGEMALLRRALELLDPHEDTRWFLTVRHNMIVALLADGCPREAFALLFNTRPLYLKMGDRWSLLRLRWVEGQVSQGMNRFDQAEAAYREVREAFMDLGLAYDAALASLDLALILAQQGKTAEMGRLAQEMLTFFESRQIHREAMAAFLVFCDAARSERAELGLLREVATFLKRARNAPGLSFSAT
jgi:tetratricopeptide (TPR) repeat protein